MSWLNDIKKSATSAYEGLVGEVKKYKNDTFKQAAVAACAVAAAADGRIDEEEVEEFLGFVYSSALNVFAVADLEKEFRAWVAKINANKTVGVAEALQVITKIKGKPEAMVICGIAWSVIEKGGVEEAERAIFVKKICVAAGVDPTLIMP